MTTAKQKKTTTKKTRAERRESRARNTRAMSNARAKVENKAADAFGLDPARNGCAIMITAMTAAASAACDPVAFKRALERAGSAAADRVPDPLKPHSALKRAVGNSKKGIKGDAFSLSWQTFSTTTDGETLVYGLYRKHADADARDADLDLALTVEVERGPTSSLVFKVRKKLTPREEAECERVRKRYRKERENLTLPIVRDVIVNGHLESLGAISVGRSSVWIVEKGDDVEVLKMADALALADLQMIPVEIYDANAPRFHADATATLLADVAKLRASCEDRLAAATSAGKNPDSSFEHGSLARHRSKANALRRKLAVYQNMLGLVGDDVTAAIKACDATINRAEVAAGNGLQGLAKLAAANGLSLDALIGDDD